MVDLISDSGSAGTRHVSPALQAYAAMTTSADRGAVRDVTQLVPRPPRPPKASAAE
jgi:hypothetical protein